MVESHMMYKEIYYDGKIKKNDKHKLTAPCLSCQCSAIELRQPDTLSALITICVHQMPQLHFSTYFQHES